jgi:hypothetical protein
MICNAQAWEAFPHVVIRAFIWKSYILRSKSETT